MIKIGFIGMGNMARAIVKGIILKDAVRPETILAYAPSQEKLNSFAEETGLIPYDSVKKMVKEADLIVVAVKPQIIEQVIFPLKEDLKNKPLLSIAAGWDFDSCSRILDESTRHLSVIPSTPVMIGEGISLFEDKHSLTAEEYAAVEMMFSAIGIVETLPADLMKIGTIVTACTPAFFNMVIEAVGDGAVRNGLSREAAYRLASQALVGTGRMQLETGLHPGLLKDMVCSPGGTTILGVVSLEKNGVRNAFIRAVDAAMKK